MRQTLKPESMRHSLNYVDENHINKNGEVQTHICRNYPKKVNDIWVEKTYQYIEPKKKPTYDQINYDERS